MRFYVLVNPDPDQGRAVTDFLYVEPVRQGEAPKCPVCGNYVGMIPTLPPIRVELETWGDIFGDLAFGPGVEILVSGRFLALFKSSGLSGLIQIGPAEVVKLTSHRQLAAGEVPQYIGCRPVQSRAAIDELASALVRDGSWRCEACRVGGIVKRAKRIVLEPNSWSGEDIFTARGLPGTCLVSERFKNMCEQGGFSNCFFVEAQKFAFDFYPTE